MSDYRWAFQFWRIVVHHVYIYVMISYMDKIKEYLQLLDIGEQEIQIYLFLLKNGPSTVLQISRFVNLPRISIYRKAEALQRMGLLNKIVRHKTTLFEVTSFDNLERIIENKRAKYKKIVSEFPKIEALIKDFQHGARNQFVVRYYAGSQELKQLIWNTLAATTELKGFGYRSLKEVVGNKFVVDWWGEIVRRKIVNKIIANPQTFAIKKKLASDLISETERYNLWQVRAIRPQILEIKIETFIYNNIYGVIQRKGDEAFGIEIENDVIAMQEEGIFDVLWDLAVEV